MNDSIYVEWMRRYSEDLDLDEALTGVKEHFWQLSREHGVSTEIRIAALEELSSLWPGFLMNLVMDSRIMSERSEYVVTRVHQSSEFFRYVLIVNGIELAALTEPENGDE